MLELLVRLHGSGARLWAGLLSQRSREEGLGRTLPPRAYEAMDKQKRIEKTREGVPIWDGDSSTFQEFEETSLIWEQSVAHHKRYLCAPKLVAELQGTARRFVLGQRPDWVSYDGGVVKLMHHLRAKLGLPQLPELTDHLTRFFKQGRRKRGETMNDYITRKIETYVRACQSMERVMGAYGKTPARLTRPSTRSEQRSWSAWDNYVPASSGPVTAESNQGDVPEEEASEGEQGDPWFSPAASERGWSQHNSWWSSSGRDDWWSSSWYDDQVCANVELLPDMIQGWYLLWDSGLDTGERNMILASLKQDFSFDRVAQELRNQWTDEDLRKRDQVSRNHGWWMDDADDEDDEVYYQQAMTSMEDLNEEGQALMSAAQDEVDRAWAAVQQGRRTLKEARDKQQQVRMSRKYYRTSFKTYRNDGKGSSKGSSTCLKCGGDHRTSQCPKSTASMASNEPEQSAPFICYADAQEASGQEVLHAEMNCEKGFAVGQGPTTMEVVAQGKAVLDGGATRTLGSVRALERVMELNQAKHGEDRLASLDLSDRPVFGFGNSTTNQCVSTALMRIQADGRDGQLQVHALDNGEGPILFSIASLRALGAIIDFSEDLVVFRKLNDKKLIQLERSATGHQLLPMVDDWYESAAETAKPVPSLRQLI